MWFSKSSLLALFALRIMTGVAGTPYPQMEARFAQLSLEPSGSKPDAKNKISDPNTPMFDDPRDSDREFVENGEKMMREAKGSYSRLFAEAAGLIYMGIKPLQENTPISEGSFSKEVMIALRAYHGMVRKVRTQRIWLNKLALAADIRAIREPTTELGNSAELVQELAGQARELIKAMKPQPHHVLADEKWPLNEVIMKDLENLLLDYSEKVQEIPTELLYPDTINVTEKVNQRQERLAQFPSRRPPAEDMIEMTRKSFERNRIGSPKEERRPRGRPKPHKLDTRPRPTSCAWYGQL